MLHRHAPDVVSLVFGTLFAGFVAIWLLSETDVIDYKEAWLAGPAILIVAGVLGLLVALRPSNSSEAPAPWTPVAAPPVEATSRDGDESDADAEPTSVIDTGSGLGTQPSSPIDADTPPDKRAE